MNKQSWTLLIVVSAVMAGAAGYLATLRSHQRLGEPGVKVVAEPVYGLERIPGGTNRVFVVGTNAVFLPARVLDYNSTSLPIDKLVCDWLPKDTTYADRVYVAPDGFHLNYKVVLMGTDRTSIHQPQYCLQGSGFVIDSQEAIRIPVERPQAYELPVMRLLLTGQRKTPEGRMEVRRGLFLYWFVCGDELTVDHARRMWSMAREMVRTGVLQRWAYVICFAECAEGAEQATLARMKQFIAASVPEFQRFPTPVAAASLRAEPKRAQP